MTTRIKKAFATLKSERTLALCRTDNGSFTIFEDKLSTNPVIVLVNENNEALEEPIVFYELKDLTPIARRETKNNIVFYVYSTDSLVPYGVSTFKEVDWPIMDMTVRDFAAIMMQKPVSLKKELNDIIKKSF
jgi:hypothetical protein